MAGKSYVSVRDGVMVRCGERYVTLARGASVPSEADTDHVDLLVARKLVAEGEPVAGFALDANAVPPFDPATAPPDAETEAKAGRARPAKAAE